MSVHKYSGGFRDLEVWKKAREFRREISVLMKKFPEYEKYKLKDQLSKSTRSITANIAEGYGRFHYQENIQFCRHSRGSLMESLDHLICALDEEYIDQGTFDKLEVHYDEILKLLNGYIAFLKKKKNNGTP